MSKHWPQQEAFKKAVKLWRERDSITLQVVAERLGLKRGTLTDYLYREGVKPSLEVLQTLASATGLSVTEFIDDPGKSAGGVDLSNESTIDRYRFDRMIVSMSDEELTDSDRQILFEDFLNSIEKLKILKAKLAKK